MFYQRTRKLIDLSILLIYIGIIAYISPVWGLPTVYLIKQSTEPNTLHVEVEHRKKTETELALINADATAPQIKNLNCDGKLLTEINPEIWTVPKDCRHIQWDIPLFINTAISEKQSSISGDMILVSTASSLLRLQDAEQEIIRIGISPLKSIFPMEKVRRDIIITNKQNAPPLFLLLGPTSLPSLLTKQTKLTYLIDNEKASGSLPDIFSHMEGLRWLSKITKSTMPAQITIAWLGVPAKKVNLTGAEGQGLFLVNYNTADELPFGKVMLLYVVLHEAFHQMAYEKNMSLPVWIKESLASYYAMRALQISAPNDIQTENLLMGFKAGALKSKIGLLMIDHQIENGDMTYFPALYSKGIVFWAAVDALLQDSRNESLGIYLQKILQFKYSKKDMADDLKTILPVPSRKWETLTKEFLL